VLRDGNIPQAYFVDVFMGPQTKGLREMVAEIRKI